MTEFVIQKDNNITNALEELPVALGSLEDFRALRGCHGKRARVPQVPRSPDAVRLREIAVLTVNPTNKC